MKALVYLGPKSMAVQNVSEPVASAGDVLIDVDSCGICGSDLHAYLGHDARRPAPLILGHEAAGVVRDGAMAGQRVTVNPLVSCGDCQFCRQGRDNICQSRQIISMPPREGAFAQQLTMPPGNLVAVPDGFALWQAALTEPMACGWHTVRLGLEGAKALEVSRDQISAIVLGGGAIGVGAALSLSAMGVKTVTLVEPNDARRARITKNLPQFKIVGAAQALAESSADFIVDAVGIDATRASATALVKPGGSIGHIGLGGSGGGLDIRRMTLQEITFFGTYTYSAKDFRDTAKAIFDGKFGDFAWVDHLSLDDGAKAFDDLVNGRVDAAKLVVMMG